MKKTLKYTLMLSLVLIMLFSVCVPVFAANGKWIKSGKRWWYKHTDGTYTKGDWEKIDGKWYLFDSDGWMLTGWWKVDGKTYFLNSDGSMKTGWLSYKGNWFYFGSNGSMKTGWLKYKNNWYYLSSDGTMKTGWLKYKNNWYYLDKDGKMANSLRKEIDGKVYCFDFSGKMMTGWREDYEPYTFYFKKNGEMKTGWMKYNGDWYFFLKEGPITNTQPQALKGSMVTGSFWYNGNRYYFDKNGIMQTGWIDFDKINSPSDKGKFYFEDDGKAHRGWLEYEGKKYYFDKSGMLCTGLIRIFGDLFYFDENGVVQTGQVEVNDGILKGTAFFDEDGKMTENNLTLGITEPVTECWVAYSDGSNSVRESIVEDEEIRTNIITYLNTLPYNGKTVEIYEGQEMYFLLISSGNNQLETVIHVDTSVLVFVYSGLCFDIDIEQFEETIKDLEFIDYPIDDMIG